MTIRTIKFLLLYFGCIYGAEQIPIREESDYKSCIRKTSIKYNNRKIPLFYNPDTMIVFTNPGMNTIFKEQGLDFLINLLTKQIDQIENERNRK